MPRDSVSLLAAAGLSAPPVMRAEPSVGVVPAPTRAARPQAYLAFDFGTRRVGAATGNSVSGSARPLTTMVAHGPAVLDAVAGLLAEWQPDALVVGVPFHPDGAAHENTRRARRFAQQLRSRFGLPVHEVDERYTTTEAKSRGAADLDAEAAAIILQQFLDGSADAAGATTE